MKHRKHKDIQIQNENLFKKSLNNGVNLLTGAGFSVLATNNMNETLPVVPNLIKKICSEFNCGTYIDRKLSWLTKQIKRIHLMGCLIIPTILFYMF